MKGSLTKLLIICLLCEFMLQACNVLNNEHDGYAYNSRHNYYFKLLAFDDTYTTAHPGDIVTASITYSLVDSDSLLFETEREVVVRDEEKLGLPLLFVEAHSGDSLSFIVPTTDFVLDTTLPKEFDTLMAAPEMRLSVRIKSVVDSITYCEHQKALLLWKQTKADYEAYLIQQYLQQNKETFDYLKNGIYKRIIKKGTGANPSLNSHVTVTYQGSLLSGEIINHSITQDFLLGSEMQVIEGLVLVIQTMKEGERAQVIVPSSYAWGENGSSDGTVPPFSSIVFDIELKAID